MAFTSAQAIIRAANFKTTVSFYQDQLGFELMILWPQPRYAVLKRDAVTLEIAENPEHKGNSAIYIKVTDVDALYEQMQSVKGGRVGNLSDRDYGVRDFRIEDPEGNLLVFGSDLEDRDTIIALKNLAA
jgi:predicted enzyme related to lactoylglutathione lyase